MPISWNEIRHNAIRFTNEWCGETREQAEAKSFWDEFFQVFGLRRRTVASFEEPVKNITGDYGYIDLFWRGMMLVEHKSRGKNLVARADRIKMSGWFSHFMNHPATYLKWGWVQISVTNLVVILLMFAIFLAAVFIPFPIS